MELRPLAEDQDSLTFWHTHDRSGRLVSIVGGAIIMVYALLTWSDPNRSLILAIGAVTAVLPPVVMAIVDVERMVRSVWGAVYYYFLELLGIVIVVTLALLDGGPTSPLTLLFLVLLVHGLGAYPPFGTWLTTGAITLAYLLLHLVTGSSAAVSATGSLTVAAIAFFGWYAARNHKAVHRHEAAMSRVLRRLAEEDSLTGLANRRAAFEFFDVALAAARPEAATSVLALDIDGFKGINDANGHAAGDQVLQCLGAALRASSRAGDLVARLGGDEFMVVLPRTSLEQALTVADRVHPLTAASPLPFRVSIGAAAAEAPMASDALLAVADAALYRVKQTGGGATMAGPLSVEA